MVPLTESPCPILAETKETVTGNESYSFQVLFAKRNIVTGKGDFLFQQFLENDSENGELVFPKLQFFSETGQGTTQVSATHVSASRSQPTTGNFLKLLSAFNAECKGENTAHSVRCICILHIYSNTYWIYKSAGSAICMLYKQKSLLHCSPE